MSAIIAKLPWWGIPVGVMVLIAALAMLTRAVRGSFAVQVDPQRDFTAPQRRQIHSRAGNRCEEKPILGRRCQGVGNAADHIVAWSRGGATVVENAQSLCQRCNTRKTNHEVSAFYKYRLTRRRRRYFPEGEERRVSAKFGVGDQ